MWKPARATAAVLERLNKLFPCLVLAKSVRAKVPEVVVVGRVEASPILDRFANELVVRHGWFPSAVRGHLPPISHNGKVPDGRYAKEIHLGTTRLLGDADRLDPPRPPCE
jgi:hypothetical protein